MIKWIRTSRLSIKNSLSMQDDGGTANGGLDLSPAVALRVTVLPVNQPPSFSMGDSVAVCAGTGGAEFPSFARDLTAGTLLDGQIPKP